MKLFNDEIEHILKEAEVDEANAKFIREGLVKELCSRLMTITVKYPLNGCTLDEIDFVDAHLVEGMLDQLTAIFSSEENRAALFETEPDIEKCCNVRKLSITLYRNN